MDMETQTVTELLDAVASERVAPAGGSVVALAGASGAALVEKAVVHTLENGQVDAPVLEKLRVTRSTLEEHRSTFVSLASSDAASVDRLFAGDREHLDQTLLKGATGIPLSIAETCSSVLSTALEIATAVGQNVALDLYSGLYLVYGASVAAIRTVEYNLSHIEATSVRNEFQTRLDAVISDLLMTLADLQMAVPLEFIRPKT